MSYVIYTLISLIYLGLMYVTCFMWHWEGWLSYAGHILLILVLTALLVVCICGYAIYDNRKSLWNAYVVPIIIILDMHFCFWEWLWGAPDERFEMLKQKWSK